MPTFQELLEAVEEEERRQDWQRFAQAYKTDPELGFYILRLQMKAEALENENKRLGALNPEKVTTAPGMWDTDRLVKFLKSKGYDYEKRTIQKYLAIFAERQLKNAQEENSLPKEMPQKWLRLAHTDAEKFLDWFIDSNKSHRRKCSWEK